MKLAIMQPYFFPYLGYFQLINAVDKFILYDNLNYIKYGWVNRNRLVVNGNPVFMIVPVLEKSSFMKIRDVQIDHTSRWKRKALKTIHLNYKKRSFFDEIFPMLEGIINADATYLTEINCAAIRQISEFLDIPAEIVTDISNYEPLENDLSLSDSDVNISYLREQNLSDTKTIRVLCVCKNEQADTFVNAIGGQALYDKKIFKRNGIDLYFIHSLPYSYEQNSKEFIRDMSIIDVLMNCGKTGTQQLLNNYELI